MSLYSMLLITFAILFWMFRVAVALTTTMNIEFFFTPLNVNIEIAVTFITLFCLIFICRRNIIAGLIYFISYIGYFGLYAYNTISVMLSGEYIIGIKDYLNLGVSIFGVLISFLIFLDIGLSQSRKKTSKSTEKTDWFYQNQQYDRKFDERADRNQYKF